MAEQPQPSSPNPNMGFDPAQAQAFWTDMMSKMGMPGVPAQPASPVDTFRQFQTTMLSAMSQWCEEYMRSPQFLESMKQSMDNALSMRQQMESFVKQATDQSMTDALAGGFATADALQRLERKIDTLQARLDAIESDKKNK